MDTTNELVKERQVDIVTKQLINTILESEEYRSFHYYLKKIKEQPELYARVCEFRKHNFELQNSEANRNMYDDIMRFQLENANIRNNELVNDFLRSELTICRMLQDITNEIVEKVDFDIEFL